MKQSFLLILLFPVSIISIACKAMDESPQIIAKDATFYADGKSYVICNLRGYAEIKNRIYHDFKFSCTDNNDLSHPLIRFYDIPMFEFSFDSNHDHSKPIKFTYQVYDRFYRLHSNTATVTVYPGKKEDYQESKS